MNIAEFLEARITEDEVAAREAAVSAGGAGWSAQQLDHEGLSVYGDDAAGQIDFDSEETVPTLRYLVRFDPARVLAECAAKRAILAAQKNQEDNDDDMAWIVASGVLLRSLAAVYSDHPDYQQEWARG